MLIRKTFVLLLSLVSLSLFAQTYDASDFITPPMKYRPVPLWFWNNDQVTEEKMLGEFDRIIGSDFYGGVAILPFGGNFKPTYLSQEYFDLYSKVISKARAAGAQMSVYDEYGFPSGSMGAINGDGVTRFKNNHPDKTIHRLDKIEANVAGGTVFTRTLDFTGKLMAVDAYNATTKEVIPLSDYINNGVLTWTAPTGSWRVIFFVSVIDGDPNVDYLSPDAVKQFIQDTHEQYFKQFPEAFGETITSTFFDEPTMYRAAGRMWTDDFNDKFQQRYGYSPEKLYPALWYNIGTGTSSARNMIFGFRAQLYAEGFMKTLAEWAESHGILSTGHQDQEEILNTTSVSGDLMLDGKYMSMPGIDKIGGNRPAENFYKVVSSSANNWDHTYVMSETYGDMGNITTETMYRIATEQFTKGINYLIPHAVWYNNQQVSFLPELSYRNPLYNKELPRFNRFLSRLRYVLARPGQHVADITVVYPIQTQLAGHYLDGALGNMQGGVSVPGTDYNQISRILTDELGRDFTYLHPEVIDEKCSVANGLLTMSNPINTEHFSVIILPGVKAISLSNMQKIEQAWLNGVTIIFTTQLPKESATMDVPNSDISAIVDRMLNTEKDKGNAIFVSSPTATTLAIALATCQATPDVKFVGTGQPFNYIHKVIEGNNVYYFGNIDQQTATNTIRLKGHLAKASLLNPRTGEITDALLSYDGDCTVINMTLAPEESMMIVENGPAATTVNHDSYTINMKFNIEKLSAGVVFAARNSKNFYMWQFNVEDAANPKLRPHVWFDGNVSLLGEIPLAQKVDLKAGTDYNLRIEVTDGSLAKTYINDVLVDERYGQFSYGMVGFRQDHSDYAGTVETALFDDISVVDGNGNSVFADNFNSSGTYSSGTLTNGWLRVNGTMTGQVLSLPLRFSNANYTVEYDVTLIKDDVAVVFASQNDDTYYMWALNCFDGSLPRIRRHVFDGGNLTFSDTEFSQFTKSTLLGSEHRMKIEVKDGIVKTYIDNTLVDTYADYSTNLVPGDIGFRIDASGPQRDEAYIDNVVVKTYDSTGNARTVLEDDFEQQNPSWFPNTETKSVEGNNKLWLHGSSLIKLMQSDKPVLNGISPTYSLRTDNGDTLYSTAGVMMTSTPKNGIYIKGDKKYVVDIK